VRVVPEGPEEVFGFGVHDRVVQDLGLEGGVLGAGGEVAVDEEVGGFEVARVEGELFDGVASVTEDCRIS
jgi:hypothetical protein